MEDEGEELTCVRGVGVRDVGESNLACDLDRLGLGVFEDGGNGLDDGRVQTRSILWPVHIGMLETGDGAI